MDKNTKHGAALHRLVSETRFSEQQISEHRAAIQHALIDKSSNIDSANFSVISAEDLQLLYTLYDERIFDNQIAATLGESSLYFELSRRMTRSAGMTERLQYHNGAAPVYKIKIAVSMFYDNFGKDQDRTVLSCGIECHDRLTAMQLTLEHELVHLIELLLWNKSSCKQSRFHTISRHLFGHEKSHHQLITPRERANTDYGVRVGAEVTFSFEGQRYTGIVNRITKRATVLVEDPSGALYSDKNRYLKFYVPVNQLKLIEKAAVDA